MASTCKLLHTASRRYFDENKKVKRFQHFQYSRHCSEHEHFCEATTLPGGVYKNCQNSQHWDHPTATSGIKIANAVDLLEAIVREPYIPWYITSLDLKDPDRHFLNAEKQPSFSHAAEDVKNLHRVLQIAMPTDWQTTQKGFAHWVTHMTPFLVDVIILNLVPNVLEVALSKSWGRADIANETNLKLLDAMVRRANNPSFKDAPLARLAVVKPFIGHGWNSKASLTPLASFLALDSVREFYMGGVLAFTDSITNVPFNPRHEVYGKSLTKIVLNGSAIGPRALESLLSRTPQLECLQLSLESKPNYGRRYNVGHLLAIICALVGSSLKELAICTNSLEPGTYTLSDMHAFTQLESLELQAECLCGPEFFAPTTLPTGGLDEYFPQISMSQNHAQPPLVDILPPSLKALRLSFPSVYSHHPRTEKIVPFRLAALLAGFGEERSMKLPLLKDIIFDSPWDLDKYMNNDSELGTAIRSVLEEVESLGIKWEQGKRFQFFRTFNERFGVKDANDDN